MRVKTRVCVCAYAVFAGVNTHCARCLLTYANILCFFFLFVAFILRYYFNFIIIALLVRNGFAVHL